MAAQNRTSRNSIADPTSFGGMLRKNRKARGLSQADLAAGAVVTAQFVGMLELGVRKPSPETVDNLIVALDLDEKNAKQLRKALKG